MKIAVLASDEGKKALYLYDFFKEGNRVEVSCLLTDNPYAPIADRMRSEGVDVVELIPSLSWNDVVASLKEREVELIVVDDFKAPFPPELGEAFKDAVICPSSCERAPIEIIEAVKKLNTPNAPYVQPAAASQPRESSETTDTDASLSQHEKEWADTLEVEIENAPVQPTNPEPPAMPEPSATPPQTPGFNSPWPNPAQNPVPASPQAMQREPMPETFLVWSVVITILCCLIPGIIAIIYSASVSSKYYAGDIEGSRRASKNAQIWCVVSIVAAVVWATLYIPLSLVL